MNKTLSLRRHARRRAFERYGIDLGARTRHAVIDAIQQGESNFVRRISVRCTVHDVTLPGGRTVRVVYDRNRKELVTLLPRDAW